MPSKVLFTVVGDQQTRLVSGLTELDFIDSEINLVTRFFLDGKRLRVAAMVKGGNANYRLDRTITYILKEY